MREFRNGFAVEVASTYIGIYWSLEEAIAARDTAREEFISERVQKYQ